MTRYIVLDTETTGLKPEEGHRIIEIGAIEIIDRQLTRNDKHIYINPERLIDEEAFKIHGISAEFLSDKPIFADIIDDFLAYIQDAELVIHNASFDVNFLDHELRWLNKDYPKIQDICRVTDTLAMARKRHAGQRNSLDALCKRYNVNNTHRQLHGARLDALLLAEVFLRMTGGQHSLFDQSETNTLVKATSIQDSEKHIKKKYENLAIILADNKEMQAHNNYLEKMQKKGACLWKLAEHID